MLVPAYSNIHWTISIINDEKDLYILAGRDPYVKNVGNGCVDGRWMILYIFVK